MSGHTQKQIDEHMEIEIINLYVKTYVISHKRDKFAKNACLNAALLYLLGDKPLNHLILTTF